MSNDLKAALTLGVVFALCVATVIWITGGKEVHAAIVSGVFTLFAASGAAYVAFWQLRKQAENTIRANRDNEAMKLKKEIYQSAIETHDEADEALQAVRRYILEGWAEVSSVAEAINNGETPPTTADFSVKKMAKKYDKASAAITKLAGLTEKWAIVDQRIVLFHKAFALSAEFRNGAYAGFMTAAYAYLQPTNGIWDLSDKSPGIFQKHMVALNNALNHELAFLSDFRVAMQNALLSDLFDHQKLSYRIPAVPNDLVIDLENAVDVSERLDALRAASPKFDMSRQLPTP